MQRINVYQRGLTHQCDIYHTTRQGSETILQGDRKKYSSHHSEKGGPKKPFLDRPAAPHLQTHLWWYAVRKFKSVHITERRGKLMVNRPH